MEINTKIRKVGNGYGMLIPKALIDSKVLTEREEVKVFIKKSNSGERI